MASPVLELPAVAGASDTGALVAISPSASAIDLPADHYLHQGAPTEWWWHIGTLQAGDRIFGFEINAASFEGKTPPFGFTQVMLSDVSNNAHYQRTTPFTPPLMFEKQLWAQSDPTKDWAVQLGTPVNCLSAIQVVDGGSGYDPKFPPNVTITGGGKGWGAIAVPIISGGQVTMVALVSPGTGYTSAPAITISGGSGSGATATAFHTYVTMNAPWGDPTQGMSVKALLNDEKTGDEIMFDLTMSQQGPPLMVWGTGVAPVPGTSGGHLETNNYYYSLTRLQTGGTITLGGETLAVAGVTWMDHEYGAFGQESTTPKWVLQAMQLDNGVCISNSISLTETPAPGSTIASHATVQRADGTTYFVPSTITLGRPWKSDKTAKTYYLELLVVIPAFFAKITVTSLIDGQEFPLPQSPVYEGVASAIGTFEGRPVSGYGWNEQAPL